MTRPRVFVVQLRHQANPDTGHMEPVMDLSPARAFGELVYLVSPNARPHDPSVINEIDQKLLGFKPTDYLLAVGNPILIGIAAAYAANNAGTVNFLLWNGRDGVYTPLPIEVFDPQYTEGN